MKNKYPTKKQMLVHIIKYGALSATLFVAAIILAMVPESDMIDAVSGIIFLSGCATVGIAFTKPILVFSAKITEEKDFT